MHNVHIGIFDTQPLAAFETGAIAEDDLVGLIRLLRAGTASVAAEGLSSVLPELLAMTTSTPSTSRSFKSRQGATP